MAAPTPIRDDSTGTTTDDTQVAPTPTTDEPLVEYDAEIVRYDDAPDECTIYPADAEEWELMTTWISAEEGSYVALVEMR